ncbi:MAG: hypothetical protein J5911_01535 [Clostridia bacterium]|nr:hypothetical protein [Clostridia bacterium]
MKYYLKQGIFPFVYLLFMSVIAFGIITINGLLWLKILLAILNVGFYSFIIAFTSFKDGQEAMKVLYANDLERMQIIRTGENRPLKIHEEYKPWKGFVFGFTSCTPLLILLLLHTVFYLSTGVTGFGVAAGIIYLMAFVFFRLDVSLSAEEAAIAPVPWYAYYGAILALPIIVLVTGIAYILGAKKIKRQRAMIEERQRSIYGDRN